MSQNQTGEFTQPLFWVVSIPLLASWMISTTIIPFLLNGFLPKGIREERRKYLKGNAKPHLPVFTTEIVLPRGSSIEHSSEVAKRLRPISSHREGRRQRRCGKLGTFVGGGIPRFRLNVSPESARPEYIFIIINNNRG